MKKNFVKMLSLKSIELGNRGIFGNSLGTFEPKAMLIRILILVGQGHHATRLCIEKRQLLRTSDNSRKKHDSKQQEFTAAVP